MPITRTIQGSISLVDGELSGQLSVFLNETSAAGADSLAAPQSIATTWTALDFGACSPADWVMVKNKDTANFVEVAVANDNSGIFTKLTPGRFFLLPAKSGVTYYAKADTAACPVAVIACEA